MQKGLIWIDLDRQNLPGTHVLIAGVGQFHKASGLRQLSSPPETALAIAEWFLPSGGFLSIARPLASVALLLSQHDDGKRSQIHGAEVPRAGFAKMSDAMEALLARAGAHPDNQLIVYIASHGLGSGDRTGILFEDYKAPGMGRRKGMTDTDQLARAMRRVKLRDKLLFLDCCRSDGYGFEATEDIGLPLIDPEGDGTLTNPAVVLRSTLAGAASYGETGEGGLTIFGQALLTALRGLAAERNNHWRISAANLAKVTSGLMELRRRDGKPLQIPQSELAANFAVTTAAATSNVALFLSVSTTEPEWRIECTLADGSHLTVNPEWPNAGHARLDVPDRSTHRLRLTTVGSTTIAEGTVDLDAPVAFHRLPDPEAPETSTAPSSGATPFGRVIVLSSASIGTAFALPIALDGDTQVSTDATDPKGLRAVEIEIGVQRAAELRPGRHRLRMTRTDGWEQDLALTVNEGESIQLQIPAPASPHEWLLPAMAAGVLPPGTQAASGTPSASPDVTVLSADAALALAQNRTDFDGPSPDLKIIASGEDARFRRYRVEDGEARRLLPRAPANQANGNPVWVMVEGKGWREITFLPTLGHQGWRAELLVDEDAPGRSKLIPYGLNGTWGPLLAFMGRRDFPGTAEVMRGLGSGTIQDAVLGKNDNPLASTAGVLAAVACGDIVEAGLKQAWLENLTNWFVGLPDGPVALGRHHQREGRMAEARNAYRLALSRGVPVFSLAVDWLAEGLESLGDDAMAQALHWSRMVDSLRTYTVLRLVGS